MEPSHSSDPGRSKNWAASVGDPRSMTGRDSGFVNHVWVTADWGALVAVDAAPAAAAVPSHWSVPTWMTIAAVASNLLTNPRTPPLVRLSNAPPNGRESWVIGTARSIRRKDD